MQRVPPLRVDDLINDLRDGTKLIALLEVLSGERLPVEKGRVLRRPHFLSNANTALQFLASKRIKLVNINPADLVDGRPPVVLGLIWTIILYFQVMLIHIFTHLIITQQYFMTETIFLLIIELVIFQICS